MKTIGALLKEIRELRNIDLNSVQEKTNIHSSLLSRIENEIRLPTREQLLCLSSFYGCNSDDTIIHWLSDKIYKEIEKEDLGLKALDVTEKRLKNDPTLDDLPSIKEAQKINLESRRYIGSKTKLTSWILEMILQHTYDCKSFLDVFSGTGIMAKSAAPIFEKVIVNDLLYSNEVVYNAFFSDQQWDEEKINSYLQRYNSIDPSKLKDNYFSINFGNKFFENELAKLVGYIREDIKKNKITLNEREHSILLSTLIYNIDKHANTVGHFDAYIKKPINTNRLMLKRLNIENLQNIEIYRKDANKLVRSLNADIAYIDPPYNSRQYSRFYHVYETLVKWNKPKLFGVALKPEPENMSKYCTVSAKETFKDLINNLDVKFLVVSYNNTYSSKSKSSENKIKLDEIKEILETRGHTQVFECSHKYFNTGKTSFDNHKELLFITEVKNA